MEKLPSLHRIAFAASCCERLISNYTAFYKQQAWGNPVILRKALDEIWEILQGKPLDRATVNKLRRECSSDEIVPHSDDFGGYVGEAQYAALAICYTLDACLDMTGQRVVKVAELVAFTIEGFYDWDESLATKEYIETIARHPFAVREMAKQNEDLYKLKQVDVLESDFIEWLRNSFDNKGKSVIDLS